MDMSELKLIKGAGGGGGGHTPVESPNTLITRTTARVLFLTSCGEVGGLADQTNPLKSVYFNNVPVQNEDNTFNFGNVQVSERYGLPVQEVMTGYPSASNSFNLGQKVTTTTAVTYNSSTSDVDAMRITIRFPALYEQETDGDTKGTSVTFNIYRRLGTGAFSLYRTVTKRDKCISPADADYLIDRPSGTGVWSVKVERSTPDNASATKANDIYFQTVAEIKYAQLPYNNRAYCGVTVSAETTGSTYPTVSFDLKGIKVKVPSNYNTTTRTYTGQWNGLFKATKEVCDNPAWVLYDMLTHPEYGLGSVISEADIDKYSFYDAAVYCDGLVPNVAGDDQEPRYTFNYQFMEQQDAWSMIQNVAASFGAVVYTAGNKVKLVQDRPTNWSRIITNSNVIDGAFEYASSQKSSRSTACIVYWNNPAENWLSVPCYYEDEAAVARYGLNVTEIAGLGITTEGQALRLAKWHVETSISNTDSLVFKVGFANAGLEPGEVVKVMDTDYAEVMNEAVVVSSTASTITLDRPVEVVSGNTFDVVGSDGSTVYTRTITTTGTASTLSFSGAAISVAAGAPLIITGAISPRLFKVTNVKEDSAGVYLVSAVEYDQNKFARVDNTPAAPDPVYQAPRTVPTEPVSLQFRESSVNDNNTIRRALTISWSRPLQGVVSSYSLRYRRNAGSWQEVSLLATSYDISPAADGTYEVQVYAVGPRGTRSTATTGTYSITLTGTGPSPLNAPTSLQLIGGGTSFSGMDINFQWTNPTSNGSVTDATLRDFEVRVIETAGSTTVRTVYIPAVAPGFIQTHSYTWSMNSADGGPRRSVQIQVRCRDTNNRLSNPVTATFTNPAPAVPSNINVIPALGSVKLTMTMPTDADFAGVLVWRSTTSGFTPSQATLVYDGSDAYIADNALADETTYYYKVAAYDVFSKSLAGTGLNVSAQYSATTFEAPGIPSGPVLPATAEQGDLFFLTTDNKLYRYTGTEWTAAVSTADLSGVITGSQIQDGAINTAKFASTIKPIEIVSSLPTSGNVEGRQVYLTTDNKLYRYTGSAWSKSVDGADIIANSITAGQIAAGAIGATEIASQAIATKHLAVTDLTNYIPNGSFTNGTLDNWWSVASGFQVVAGNGTTDPAPFHLYIPASVNNSGAYASEQFLDAAPADKFRVMFKAKATSAVTATTFRVIAYWLLNDGTIGNSSYYFNSIGTTWADFEATLTAPANTAGVRFRFFRNTHSDTSAITLALIQARRMNAGKLIVDGSITGNLIAANTIQAGNIQAGTITGNEIAANTITANNLVAGTITSAEIATGTLTANNIAANTITGNKIAADTITAANIAANAITASEISANAVTSAKINAGAVTAAKISVTSLSAISATIGTLRTATTGARTEIADNVIKVYDTSNVLRVRIGDLTL